MRTILIFFIHIYQKYISPDSGSIPRVLGRSRKTCIYYPTCSQYTKEAIEIYGSFKGVRLGVSRIARCNPFNEPGVDLVPPRKP
jgi:putative membrane protein insertion efficiency factor